MARLTSVLVAAFLFFSLSPKAMAHFGLLLPDDDIIEGQANARLGIIVAFCHPFELTGMDLELPQKFGVFIHNTRYDLTRELKSAKFLGHRAWSLKYPVRRPGDHIFYMIPQPYWEQMEGKYIQHITKVIVNAYGLEDHWDEPIGLPAEIVPMTRPYGLWAGNVFCGKVFFHGKPGANLEVEVEHLNDRPPKLMAPKGAFITQVVKTNSSGEFCYTMPVSGWWGFSALSETQNALKHNGTPVPLEVGAVIWIKASKLLEE